MRKMRAKIMGVAIKPGDVIFRDYTPGHAAYDFEVDRVVHHGREIRAFEKDAIYGMPLRHDEFVRVERMI